MQAFLSLKQKQSMWEGPRCNAILAVAVIAFMPIAGIAILARIAAAIVAAADGRRYTVGGCIARRVETPAREAPAGQAAQQVDRPVSPTSIRPGGCCGRAPEDRGRPPA
jgi:hypothetical protein